MLSSTNGSINSFSHNFYSSSSFNHCPPTTISQESNDMSLNYIICPNSPIPYPNIQVPYNQEKADHDLTISQDLHNDPQKRRSARKEYRPKKIYTAQGLRDRRVRLSKEAARKFFKLQDALGFDKASKTLEWLMNESRKAIEQLGSWRTVSSTRKEEKQSQFLVGDEKERPGLESTVVSKESRAKARARARERTRAKTMSNDNRLVICPEDNCGLLQRDPLKDLPGSSLSQVLEEEEEEDDDGLLGLDGQNPSVIFEAQEVEEPRSKPPRAGGKTIVHESAFLTSWFTHS